MERGQISRIMVDIADDDRFPGFQRRAAQPLRDWETRIRRRLVACVGENHEFIFDDLVNADPAIIARRANHLCELLHSLSGAPASQRECADLLELLTRRFLHSRESNLVQKKTSASEISTFCD
jgi:hypothetical protein